jgi:hypothetical protein
MFRVQNADFIADKLATELLPNQEFREVLSCTKGCNGGFGAEIA